MKPYVDVVKILDDYFVPKVNVFLKLKACVQTDGAAERRENRSVRVQAEAEGHYM